MYILANKPRNKDQCLECGSRVEKFSNTLDLCIECLVLESEGKDWYSIPNMKEQ